MREPDLLTQIFASRLTRKDLESLRYIEEWLIDDLAIFPNGKKILESVADLAIIISKVEKVLKK